LVSYLPLLQDLVDDFFRV